MMGVLTLSNLLAWTLQAGLIVAAALLVSRVVQLREPAAKYVVLRGVLALCLLAPVVGLFADHGRTGAPGGTVDAEIVGAVVQGAGAGRPGPGAALSQLSAAAAGSVAILLAFGVLARLAWIAAGIVRLRALRHAGEAAPADAAHEELQTTIGTRAAIRYVKGLGQPVTFGVRRPTILLPQSLQAHHPSIARAVVAHELWHVRRRDWMWTVAEEVLRAVLWFHPAIWVLLSRIQAAREEVVDHLAILSTGSRRAYADALLAYADERPLFAATAFAQRRHLVHRMILISKETAMSSRRIVGSCAAIAAVVLSAGWYGVLAFPLSQSSQVADLFASEPGPVELRARSVTPDNPIPRRTYFVPADYPNEAAALQARGTATVLVAIDETGHLAETRLLGLAISTSDPSLQASISGPRGLDSLKPLLDKLPAERRQALAGAIQALAQAAVGAVRQWQFGTPAEGPLVFVATVPMGPEPAPMEAHQVYIRSTQQRLAGEPGGAFVRSAGGLDAPGAVRVGGTIKPPTKIRHVNPLYPDVAREARVSGVVILEALIGPDGSVEDVHVLRSIPLLDRAAVDAVRQWQFTPTLLNGVQVPVIMTMTVNFTLQ